MMRFEGRRLVMSDILLATIVAAWLFITANITFWQKGLSYLSAHPASLAALAAGLFALHLAAFLSVSVKYAIKPLYIFMFFVAGAASWYTDRLGVIIDREMIRNAAVTTANEARHLVTPRFLLHMLIFAILPSLFVLWVRIDHKPFGRKVTEHLFVIVPSLLVAGTVTLLNYSAFASTFREHRDLMGTLNPAAPVVAAVKYVKRTYFTAPVVVEAIGKDAATEENAEVAAKEEAPHVLVVVAGETARAKDFSLMGYERETNPVLKAHDNVFAFPDTTSCGTATAVSLPCMFSVYERTAYSDTKGESTESVLDVLMHAGIRTEWWDANTGSKGVAARTVEINLSSVDDPRFCEAGECRDDILVDRLKQELPKITGNTVFVLHQIGSHGPAYYMRYPQEWAPFTPDCRSSDFADCTDEEIRNAYDNTIAYTDKILGDVIDALAAEGDRINAAMIYMSDHGESLGENGLYLHGAPWFMAPEEQTRVPFIAWLSPQYAADEHVDLACLAGKTGSPYSHDNLFHTILGSMEIQTGVYDAALDVFAPCRLPDEDEAHG